VTEGEAWARELLSELRAQGYRPHAWLRFLARSFERARATRQERPHEHLQALLIGVAGVASWAALAPFRPYLALAGALWWTVVIAMLDWHLGMLEDDHGYPIRRLGLPNLLSLARLGLMPAVLTASPGLLAALLIPAGLSDFLDGPLARRRREETRLGVWLDGSADTVVLSAAAVGAVRHGLLSWWVAGLVVARQAAPWLLVAAAYFIRGEPPQIRRAASGKAAGMLLFGGLLLGALRLPGAVPFVVLGAVGGLATLTVMLVRAQAVRARPSLPPPA
jgi:phosphatidylglycerophosphate synthase